MEKKTLAEIMSEQDQRTWGPAQPDRRKPKTMLPVGKLQWVRDGSIKYDAPKSPITSPTHCLEIFRTIFDGADKELVAALSLTMQNEYINCPKVAWGTIGHVVVHPGEVFKNVLAKDNAAKFILAHNHPEGNATPSPEDMAMMEEIRDLGIRLGCRLVDFMIVGQADNSYYSHRELHYDYF